MDCVCKECGYKYIQYDYSSPCPECCIKECEDEGEDVEFYATDNIVCPYCGLVWEPDCEHSDYFTDGSYTETCDECGHSFNLSVNVSITYSSERL